jgi:hypothetical protein
LKEGRKDAFEGWKVLKEGRMSRKEELEEFE